MSEGAEIEHRHLRSAIEYAVLIAEETQRRKPPMAVPNELRPFFGKPRVPSGALGRLRRSIEADDLFRSRIAAGASPELVDDVGRLWLQRPDGWVDDALAAVRAAEAERAAVDGAAALRRAEKRRVAAEEAAVRARAEAVRLQALVDEQRTELDRLVADVAKADDALAEMRAELIDVRNEARHARDREAAATAKLERAAAASAVGRATQPPRADGADPAITAEMLAALRAEIDSEMDEIRAGGGRAVRRRSTRRSARGPRPCSLARPTPSRQPPRTGMPPRRRTSTVAPPRWSAGFVGRGRRLPRPYRSPRADRRLQRLDARLAEPVDRRAALALINAVENMRLRFGTEATIVFDGAEWWGELSPSSFHTGALLAERRDRRRRDPRRGRAHSAGSVTWSSSRTTRRSPTTCVPLERTCCRATPCSPCSDRPVGSVGPW